MNSRERQSVRRQGGLIHTYLGYDPKRFPSPTAPRSDIAGTAMEHMLMHGSMRELTEEQLRDAIRIDPSQIAGLGPSLDAIAAMLEERRRKILESYETEAARHEAMGRFHDAASAIDAPKKYRQAIDDAVRRQQIRDLERLWYKVESEDRGLARDLLHLVDALGSQYEVEQLAANYNFTGRTEMTVDEALAIKEELETIDKLLEQIREAMKNAKVGIIDLDELREFVQEADVEQLRGFQRQIEQHIREQAELQGLERDASGQYRLTPKAMKLFQSKLLDEIFSELEASRSGRHRGPIEGEGVVELPKTRGYEFGDSPTHIDLTQTMINAAVRGGGSKGRPRIKAEDIDVHLTRNTPKCATTVLIDMSGSMRSMGQYIQCKRMALALDGLIRSEYPGDFLQTIEMATFAKARHISEVPGLMPKPVTIRDPVVRLRVDMSDPEISEGMIHPHFTNIQHGLRLSRQLLAAQDTPNRQVFLITDGLPTAHFENGPGTGVKGGGSEFLYMLYPPDPLTERATMREAMACKREGITINIFLLPSWSQDEDDIAFAHRLAEQTGGRVLFTGGRDLDRFVLWDYVSHRRKIIG